MDRGTYAAASGGLLENRRLQVVANNLANVNTVGFKAERLTSRQQEFSDTLAAAISADQPRASADHERTPGVVSIESVTDFTPGPINFTGNPLDVALREPDDFFVVQTPEGEQYTRAGNFTLDGNGTLVTQDGFPVLGEGGPITAQDGQPVISDTGTVTVNGEPVGRLRTVRIEDPTQLERKEGVRFKLREGAQGAVLPAETAVASQSVEMPNVGVVESMVDMIAAQRSFEGYTKTMQTIDELNDVAIRSARVTG